MPATDAPSEGATFTRERTFTTDEVRAFGSLSRDEQSIHTDPDDEGRLVVHGLLTATLSTQIGGELEVLARSMSFEFVAPVYTGETIRCTWTTTGVSERPDRYDLRAEVVCRRVDAASGRAGESDGEAAGSDGVSGDEDGPVVLRGTVDGLVWK